MQSDTARVRDDPGSVTGYRQASRPCLYEKLSLLRNQGRLNSGTFVHDALGMNFHVTDLQCAVGRAQYYWWAARSTAIECPADQAE